MKRLKSKYPFRGYGSWVLTIASVLSPALGIAVLAMSDDRKIRYVMPLMFIAFALILALARFILTRTNAEEQYLIEQAKEYDWRPLDGWMHTAVKDKYRMPWHEAVIASVLIVVFLAVFGVKSESLTAVIPPLIIAAAVIMIWIISSAVKKKKWSEIDESAECIMLEADHTYTVRNYGRGRTYINEYYVFYIREGRLVLKKEHSNCNKVCIVKFNGMITYIEYAEKRRFD